MYKQYRIYFFQKENEYDEWESDETEFSVEENTFATMANELTDLFNVFCHENNFVSSEIEHIEEVPYDGEM